MTTRIGGDPLARHTDARLARPLPAGLRAARKDVLDAVQELGTISDASLSRPWPWKGEGEEEVRYGFYRIGEAFELAAIDAQAAIRAAGAERGRAAELIAPATVARWDLQGLLIPLPDSAWDANPGGGEWTIRQTMGHVIGGQRSYGVVTAWWQDQGFRADDPKLPPSTPDAARDGLPSEEAEAQGAPAQVRGRLGDVLDAAAERLGGLPADRLRLGTRWSGFAVDIGFRLGRWSSHIREHTIQVEKTLVMLDHQSTEVDRLIRLVLAAWGRAEAVVYGSTGDREALAVLSTAAAGARTTAAKVAGIARG